MGCRLGPGSPAGLLVVGCGRRIQDWPHLLAAAVASTRRRTRILRSSVSLFGVLITLHGEVRTVGRLLALTGDASVARSLSLEICTLFLRAVKMLTCPLLYTPGVMVQTVSSGQGFDMPVVLATGAVLGQGCCLPVVFSTTEPGTHSANCAEDADSTAQFFGKQLTCPLFFNDRCRAVSPSAQHRGGSAVAVLPWWSMSLLLQFIEKVWTSL